MLSRCVRCEVIALSLVALILAIALYPLSQWDEDIAWSTRIDARLLDHVMPRPSFNLCYLLAILLGTHRPEASRYIMSWVAAAVDISYVSSGDHTVAGVPVRLYRPARVDETASLPVLVFYHGGGYVTGTLRNYDASLARWCDESGFAVVSVNYRLAPEHIYPAAFDDCLAVTKSILGDPAVAAELRVNSSLVSVGGDSAGGSLAAAISLHIGRTDLPRLRAQISIYPAIRYVFSDPNTTFSFSAPGGLDPKATFLYRSWYLGGEEDADTLRSMVTNRSPVLLPTEVWENASLRLNGSDVELITPDPDKYPYAEKFLSESLCPILARDLSMVPPTIILLAGIDPLYSDGFLYQQRLQAAGVEAQLVDYGKQIHGFFANAPSNMTVMGVRFVYGNQEARDAISRSVTFVLEHSGLSWEPTPVS
ncbi:esterase LipI-like [Sycon ciliatum]|uniref:esterase LipI-like n=1 Tax=Sycon ciliatum TaxID=27933 RepID=UPI0031F6BD15